MKKTTTSNKFEERREEPGLSVFFQMGFTSWRKLEDHVRGICDFSQNVIDQEFRVEDLDETGPLHQETHSREEQLY